MTEANDDAPAAGRPTGPVRAPAPPPAEHPAAGPEPAGPGTQPAGEPAHPGQPGEPAHPGQPGGPAHPGQPAYPGQAGPHPGQAGPPPGYPPYYGPPYYGPPQFGPPGWRPQPVPLSPDGRPLADFGTRLLAYTIDTALLTAVAAVVFLPVFIWLFVSLMPDMAATGDPYAPATPDLGAIGVKFVLAEVGLILFLLVGYYVYYVEMMFRTGQTIGKKLIKVRVVPSTPGATLTRGMAAKRYLVEFVGGLVIPLFSYLDGFWQLWDKPYQQTLHDKVAGTVVVKVAP